MSTVTLHKRTGFSILALCLLLFISSSTFAQSTSDNYALEVGQVCWGGGNSNGSGKNINGVLTIGAAGHAHAEKLVITSGVQASTFSNEAVFLAAHLGGDIDTVTRETQQLRVLYGGDTSTVEGTLYFRYGGQQVFQSLAMSRLSNDTLVVDIDTGYLNMRGLEYYFTVMQGSDAVDIADSQNPKRLVTWLTNTQAQRPDSLKTLTYRMIGLPLDVSGSNTVISVFGDDFGGADPTSWRLGSFNSSVQRVIEYPNAAAVIPGQGYWLSMRHPKPYGADGFSVIPNRYINGKPYYEYPVFIGWNQVANPLPFSVTWDSVKFEYQGRIVDHDTTLLDDFAYFYTGNSYSPVNTLIPWDAYFIFFKKSGVKMLFPYEERQGGTRYFSSVADDAEDQSFDWSISFKLSREQYEDINLIGVRSDATAGADWFDYSDPPPPPGAPRMGFLLPDGDPYLRSRDIRPPIGEGAVWEIQFINLPGSRLSISGLADIRDDFENRLAFDNGIIILFNHDTTITLPNDVSAAKFIVGNNQYSEKELEGLLPKTVALYQNYPNPFNPSTTIRFALPQASEIRLDIYNILGQRVMTLLNGNVSAGVHEISWNAVDASGQPVATGLYFFRLTTDNAVISKKMLLLK